MDVAVWELVSDVALRVDPHAELPVGQLYRTMLDSKRISESMQHEYVKKRVLIVRFVPMARRYSGRPEPKARKGPRELGGPFFVSVAGTLLQAWPNPGTASAPHPGR